MAHRTPPLPKIGKKPPPTEDPRMRGFEWTHDWPACICCGSALRPHLADGLCRECWRIEHDLPPLATSAPPPPPDAGTGGPRPRPAILVLFAEQRGDGAFDEAEFRRLLEADD